MSADERWSQDDTAYLWGTSTPSPTTTPPSFTPEPPMPAAAFVRRELMAIDPATVEVKDMKWLEKGFLPQGELTILQGHGGTNKGTHSCYWAARVTRGETHDGLAGSVLFAAAEDSLATTLKPRLIAAGADLSKIRFLKLRVGEYEDGITIPDDVHLLASAIEENDARLVVVDPILSHLSGKVDSYRDHDVKRSLTPLKAMAEETGCAILAVHHFNKDTSRGAVRSGQASGAFTNTARVVLAMVEHTETERVLEVVKSNVTRVGLRYLVKVETVRIEGIEDDVVKTVNAGETDLSAEELLKPNTQEKGGKKVTAKEMILAELAAAQQSMDYLKARGESLDISGKTVWRAANELKAEGKVGSSNSGPGTPWFWFLKEEIPEADEAAQTLPTNVANPHQQKTFPYTTDGHIYDLTRKSDLTAPDFPKSAFMAKSVLQAVPNAEIRRQLETHRPDLIGRDDITTRS